MTSIASIASTLFAANTVSAAVLAIIVELIADSSVQMIAKLSAIDPFMLKMMRHSNNQLFVKLISVLFPTAVSSSVQFIMNTLLAVVDRLVFTASIKLENLSGMHYYLRLTRFAYVQDTCLLVWKNLTDESIRFADASLTACFENWMDDFELSEVPP